jgi:6-methylsalicylate decarboxylase
MNQPTSAPSKPRRRIDVHQHIYPPRFTRRMIDDLVADAPDYPEKMYLDWKPEQTLAMMDAHAIDTVMVSLTSPGLWFGDAAAARDAAREFNELAASMIRDNPGHFGAFAPIPLPDEAGAMAEIAYALDTLKLNGIGLHSSYAGRLLGSPEFGTVFDELNRRKATIFVHPVANTRSDIDNPWLTPPILEFVFDTTRTIVSLIASGTLARCPDINFIFPHGGGPVFALARRIEPSMMRRLTPEQRQAYTPRGIAGALQTLYYDVVSASNPTSLSALRTMAPIERLLFGTDFPFVPPDVTIDQLQKLELTASEMQAIESGNALKICRL